MPEKILLNRRSAKFKSGSKAGWSPIIIICSFVSSVLCRLEEADSQVLNYLLEFVNWSTLSPHLKHILDRRVAEKSWDPHPCFGTAVNMHCRVQITCTWKHCSDWSFLSTFFQTPSPVFPTSAGCRSEHCWDQISWWGPMSSNSFLSPTCFMISLNSGTSQKLRTHTRHYCQFYSESRNIAIHTSTDMFYDHIGVLCSNPRIHIIPLNANIQVWFIILCTFLFGVWTDWRFKQKNVRYRRRAN